MKAILSAFLNFVLIITASIVVAAQASTPNVEGNWLATLSVSGSPVRLILKVERSANGYAATFDSPDQGAANLTIDSIVLDGMKLTFIASKYGISYEGTLSDAGDEISGTFKQRMGEAPMLFKKVAEAAKFNRPQDPKKPYPYDEQEVSYRNEKDNVKLAGTLTLPRGGGRHPAVLLITGSGSQDRDETIAGHRPFLVLSDFLTRNGIAVLRVDDRGIGGSDAGSLTVTSENFAQDVLAGVNFLKQRKEIDPKMIGLVGHSEGGMIAPMVASSSSDVAFIVLLAGPGQQGEDLIYTQTERIHKAQGTPPETLAHIMSLLRRINAIAKAENDETRTQQRIREEIAAYVGSLSDVEKKQFEPAAKDLKTFIPLYASRWYRYFITYDPRPVLKSVRVPVLAVNGEHDLQVASKENLDLIAASLKAGRNGDVTIKAFPQLNHLFQTSATGLLSEYIEIDETISPEVLKTVSDWILHRTVQKP